MTCPTPSDRELLRAVYRHLDRKALLADLPSLSARRIDDFFRRIADLLPPDEAPPTRKPGTSKPVTLYTDGGSRGNPGPAGYGFLLMGGSGKVLHEGCGSLGRATNNEAEYEGVIAGLRAAIERGAGDIVIRSDSQLLIRQRNGSYKVKSRRLMPLFLRVKELLSDFTSWHAEHIPREENTRADALANQAMDEAAV